MPFSQSTPQLHTMVHHPCANDFRQVLLAAQDRDRKTIARLWLSEGIPYAFRDKASAYDELRYWLANKLSVNGKDVTIVGSGRIGFSMSPSKYGVVFNNGSDLDFSIVNENLFNACSADAVNFKREFEAGRLNPNKRQKVWWPDTIKRLPSNLSAGFVDTFNIPGDKEMSPSILLVKDAMWQAGEKLKVTEGVPAFTKITARVYKGWDELVSRVALNLNCLR